MSWKIINGNSAEVLKTYPENSFDCVVTDPPYGIDFLDKDWDSNTGDIEVYKQCFRVLKPGGHLLAFSAARTYHHLAMNVERSGFEIRDQIMWIYSSGFPKSQDIGRQLHKKIHGKPDKQHFDPAIMISENGNYRHPDTNKVYRKLPDINGDNLKVSHEGNKYGCIFEEIIEVNNEWSGWGTSLKPAHEPIVMARKPVIGSIRENVQKYGTGAINIEESRVGDEVVTTMYKVNNEGKSFGYEGDVSWQDRGNYDNVGRYPSNVLGEIPEYQKYFYCPKVNAKERHIGCDMKNAPKPGSNGHGGGVYENNNWADSLQNVNVPSSEHNTHPTVKPIELMKYLIKLVTPPNGHVLDPFNGSGSTGCAAVELGYDYTGIELDPNYAIISNKRISAWESSSNATYNKLFEEK